MCSISRDFQFVANTILVPSLIRSCSFIRATSFPTSRLLRRPTSCPLSLPLLLHAPAVPLTLFRHRRRFQATPARERGETCLENVSVSGMECSEEIEESENAEV